MTVEDRLRKLERQMAELQRRIEAQQQPREKPPAQGITPAGINQGVVHGSKS